MPSGIYKHTKPPWNKGKKCPQTAEAHRIQFVQPKNKMYRKPRAGYSKLCTLCKQVKSLEKFGKSKKSTDKKASWCKLCDRKYKNSFYQKIRSAGRWGKCKECGGVLSKGSKSKLCFSCHLSIKEYPFGKDHPRWLGGKSFEPYSPEFNEKLKGQIRERDSYRCQECFRHQDELYTKKGKKYKLSVHHIDYDKQNNVPENLISLCKSCHNQTNYSREDWTDYFSKRIGGLNG